MEKELPQLLYNTKEVVVPKIGLIVMPCNSNISLAIPNSIIEKLVPDLKSVSKGKLSTILSSLSNEDLNRIFAAGIFENTVQAINELIPEAEYSEGKRVLASNVIGNLKSQPVEKSEEKPDVISAKKSVNVAKEEFQISTSMNGVSIDIPYTSLKTLIPNLNNKSDKEIEEILSLFTEKQLKRFFTVGVVPNADKIIEEALYKKGQNEEPEK